MLYHLSKDATQNGIYTSFYCHPISTGFCAYFSKLSLSIHLLKVLCILSIHWLASLVEQPIAQ